MGDRDRSVTPDQRYERWVDHLEQIIREVYSLHLYRHLWRELAAITQAADLPASLIFDALGVWYTSTQGLSVRRLVDRRKGVVSLRRLLEDIGRHPGVVSRERHVALWGDELGDLAHANYDLFSGGRDRGILDRALVQGDVAALVEAASVVEAYVNDAIAHAADLRRESVPTFDDLNAAIDGIGDLVKKYASLLKAEVLFELVPVIQYDWKGPFRKAWLPEDE